MSRDLKISAIAGLLFNFALAPHTSYGTDEIGSKKHVNFSKYPVAAARIELDQFKDSWCLEPEDSIWYRLSSLNHDCPQVRQKVATDRAAIQQSQDQQAKDPKFTEFSAPSRRAPADRRNESLVTPAQTGSGK